MTAIIADKSLLFPPVQVILKRRSTITAGPDISTSGPRIALPSHALRQPQCRRKLFGAVALYGFPVAAAFFALRGSTASAFIARQPISGCRSSRAKLERKETSQNYKRQRLASTDRRKNRELERPAARRGGARLLGRAGAGNRIQFVREVGLGTAKDLGKVLR
jgi:hypothetical protein